MRVTFWGHAAVSIHAHGKDLLIDPFLTDNPLATVEAGEVKADYILVSHAHADHLGDTLDIAKRTGATIISTAEVAGMCEAEGATSHAMHVGGKQRFDFGTVRLTPAFHGSGINGGLACGFIVESEGKRLYHAGDTGLFGDMRLLAEIEPLDLALMPIGGNFTMDVEDAIRAVQMMKPCTVIPMHYNTWPVIEANPEDFKSGVEKTCPDVKCVVLSPGEAYTLDN